MPTVLKIFSVSILLLFFSQSSTAQFYSEYKTSIGARFGSPYAAVTYKTFLSDRNAVEFYIGYRDFANASWVSVSGAYQRHYSLDKITEGLLGYFGAGPSMYFWSFDANFTGLETNTTMGANAYIGFDYRLPSTNFAVSIDWVPVYFFGGLNDGFSWDYGGVGVRYVLK